MDDTKEESREKIGVQDVERRPSAETLSTALVPPGSPNGHRAHVRAEKKQVFYGLTLRNSSLGLGLGFTQSLNHWFEKDKLLRIPSFEPGTTYSSSVSSNCTPQIDTPKLVVQDLFPPTTPRSSGETTIIQENMDDGKENGSDIDLSLRL